jgi:hypothetical protein
MVCKSLIAKPCSNYTVVRNSELHKCLSFVHVRVAEMAKAIIRYPFSSGYSVVQDCAWCICLVRSAQKVAITVDSPQVSIAWSKCCDTFQIYVL